MFSEQTNIGINGAVKIPGDKSISHRSIIIPSISSGICEISNILKSDDVLCTMNAFREMGVEIKEENKKIIINGKGLESLKKPNQEIYLGNSGTSARLLTGLLSSQSFNSTLEGDKSLSSRPMHRIMDTLKLMGAEFDNFSGTLPLNFLTSILDNSKIALDFCGANPHGRIIL